MLKLRFKNNKHNAVWLVEPKVTLGRAASNDLIVDDATVAERHVEIIVNHEELTLVNVSGGQSVFVNRTEVSDRSPLQIDDVITLGRVQLQVVDPKREPKAGPTVVRRDNPSGWALKANHSALSNRVFALKEVTVVGRSNECDITLAAAHLSRRHARLEIRDGLLYVMDLESSNGTYLNGRRITEARVKRGDELRFDTLSFGVIGPADDLDKTTVRSVQAIAPAKARPAPAAGPAPAAQRNRPVRKPAAAAGAAAEGMQSSPAAGVSAQKPHSMNGLVILGVVLLLLAGAGWYAYQKGMF